MNELWNSALNLKEKGDADIKYFACLHDDCIAEDYWLDTLIDCLERHEVDVLSAVIRIKDDTGLTSTAIGSDDPFIRAARLTMSEVFSMDTTFTCDRLLVNTGCFVCRFDKWAEDILWDMNHRRRRHPDSNEWVAEVEPEDWFFSRQCHTLGLKVAATRIVHVYHRGPYNFGNGSPEGKWTYDHNCVTAPIVGREACSA